MSQPAASRSMFAVFRKRDFSLMWSAQLVSTIGSSLTDLAAGILVFRLTHSVLSVGLTLMVTALPTLLVGLVAGVFVDRFDRKRILLASDLLRALLVVCIPFGRRAVRDPRAVRAPVPVRDRPPVLRSGLGERAPGDRQRRGARGG